MVEMPDWEQRGEYISARRARRPGDTDVMPFWADEAFADAAAVTFEPDYASRSGEGVRTVGYSDSARFIITVITVRVDGHLWGVNAWRSNDKDSEFYARGEAS